jgi:Undecaprenyl-phosphate galactose phosphotransferase WbaP
MALEETPTMGTTAGMLTRRSERPAAVSCRIASRSLTAAASLATDLAAVLTACFLAVQIWSLIQPAVQPFSYMKFWPAALVFPAVYAALGLYPGVGISPVEELRLCVIGSSVVYLAGAASMVLERANEFSRGVFLGAWLMTLVSVPLFRAWLRGVCAGCAWWGIPVLVLGAGEAGQTVVSKLQAVPAFGLKPVAFLDDDADKEPSYMGVAVAGPLSAACELGRELGICTALVAMPSLKRNELLQVLERSGAAFSHLIVLPDLLGMASLWVSARDLGGVLGLEVRQNLLIPANRRLKRMLDLLIASIGGLLSLPLLAIAIAWIKCVSPGNALFSQERGGEGGAVIRIYKLRTMRPNAEAILDSHLQHNPEARLEWKRHFKLKNDPRLLPVVGHLLRRTSLDELPQLWNVIKGDMSLVGPRPFPDYHLQCFPSDFRSLRARVQPGLTGLWQVTARSDGDLGVQQALDTYYIRNWSPWLDLHILARTVRAVLFGKGAY